MTDRLFNTLWHHTDQPISVFLETTGPWPFDLDVAEHVIRNDCDWLSHTMQQRYALKYQGRVNFAPVEGAISIGYLSEAEFNEVVPPDANGNSYWAVAVTSPELDDNTRTARVMIWFNANKVDDPAKFAGILFHELLHAIGVQHYDGEWSVMNASPYNPYWVQGTPKAADFLPLYRLSHGLINAEPKIYDYGDPHAASGVLIHIPCIEAWGAWYEVTLRAFCHYDGFWRLEAKREDYRTAPYRKPTCFMLPEDKLEIRVRYGMRDNVIRATLEGAGTIGTTMRFKVDEVA